MYQTCEFKVGDYVMFRNRCQSSPCGMKVQEVDINMFNVMMKVDDKWWTPLCFMSLEDWRKL